MGRLLRLLPEGRALVALDILLILWAGFWIWAGFAVSSDVDGLKGVTQTLRESGLAIQQTGQTLQTVGNLPIVGGGVADNAEQISRAGESAVASARSSRESIDRLSVLLGLAVAVIPSLPLLGFYLPVRVSRFREARALGRAVRSRGPDPAFRDFLADRALQTLSYERLRQVTDEPWERDARTRSRLACAELERLGVDAEPIRRD